MKFQVIPKKRDLYPSFKNSSAKLSTMFCALRNLIFFHRAYDLLENIDKTQGSHSSKGNLVQIFLLAIWLLDVLRRMEKFSLQAFEKRNKETWIEK